MHSVHYWMSAEDRCQTDVTTTSKVMVAMDTMASWSEMEGGGSDGTATECLSDIQGRESGTEGGKKREQEEGEQAENSKRKG